MIFVGSTGARYVALGFDQPRARVEHDLVAVEPTPHGPTVRLDTDTASAHQPMPSSRKAVKPAGAAVSAATPPNCPA